MNLSLTNLLSLPNKRVRYNLKRPLPRSDEPIEAWASRDGTRQIMGPIVSIAPGIYCQLHGSVNCLLDSTSDAAIMVAPSVHAPLAAPVAQCLFGKLHGSFRQRSSADFFSSSAALVV